ncbi:hypothetical protein [Sebaldella sp. S0638]|uniref:hypothetical protein n=1 Tax=Sebaldella sp. S0638 TaxID=2957809 RepID=UPI00209EFAE1|nr:hypothetical protein [Sebaldella sp. S0638]MCP1226386.1 hypothetical protein [Sebaldella sp. S0638]
MGKIIMTAGLVLLSAGLYAQNETDFDIMEEDISPAPVTKLEKAEAELAHMQEKVDFYKRVVRSVEREEEELKELKKQRIRNIRKK